MTVERHTIKLGTGNGEKQPTYRTVSVDVEALLAKPQPEEDVQRPTIRESFAPSRNNLTLEQAQQGVDDACADWAKYAMIFFADRRVENAIPSESFGEIERSLETWADMLDAVHDQLLNPYDMARQYEIEDSAGQRIAIMGKFFSEVDKIIRAVKSEADDAKRMSEGTLAYTRSATAALNDINESSAGLLSMHDYRVKKLREANDSMQAFEMNIARIEATGQQVDKTSPLYKDELAERRYPIDTAERAYAANQDQAVLEVLGPLLSPAATLHPSVTAALEAWGDGDTAEAKRYIELEKLLASHRVAVERTLEKYDPNALGTIVNQATHHADELVSGKVLDDSNEQQIATAIDINTMRKLLEGVPLIVLTRKYIISASSSDMVQERADIAVTTFDARNRQFDRRATDMARGIVDEARSEQELLGELNQELAAHRQALRNARQAVRAAIDEVRRLKVDTTLTLTGALCKTVELPDFGTTYSETAVNHWLNSDFVIVEYEYRELIEVLKQCRHLGRSEVDAALRDVAKLARHYDAQPPIQKPDTLYTQTLEKRGEQSGQPSVVEFPSRPQGLMGKIATSIGFRK